MSSVRASARTSFYPCRTQASDTPCDIRAECADRIQAALSKAVIMVQSGESGGSWHASRAALRYGRRLAVPAPTSADEAQGEPKVQGNVALATGTASAKIALLKCEISDLSRLTILRSRDDYPEFERVLLEPDLSTPARQHE